MSVVSASPLNRYFSHGSVYFRSSRLVVRPISRARLGSLRVFANCDTARTQAHTWQTKHGANGLKNSRKNSTTGCLNVWGSPAGRAEYRSIGPPGGLSTAKQARTAAECLTTRRLFKRDPRIPVYLAAQERLLGTQPQPPAVSSAPSCGTQAARCERRTERAALSQSETRLGSPTDCSNRRPRRILLSNVSCRPSALRVAPFTYGNMEQLNQTYYENVKTLLQQNYTKLSEYKKYPHVLKEVVICPRGSRSCGPMFWRLSFNSLEPVPQSSRNCSSIFKKLYSNVLEAELGGKKKLQHGNGTGVVSPIDELAAEKPPTEKREAVNHRDRSKSYGRTSGPCRLWLAVKVSAVNHSGTDSRFESRQPISPFGGSLGSLIALISGLRRCGLHYHIHQTHNPLTQRIKCLGKPRNEKVDEKQKNNYDSALRATTRRKLMRNPRNRSDSGCAVLEKPLGSADFCGMEELNFLWKKNDTSPWRGGQVKSKTEGRWIFDDPYVQLAPGEKYFSGLTDEFDPPKPPKSPEDCPEDKMTPKPNVKKEETTPQPDEEETTDDGTTDSTDSSTQDPSEMPEEQEPEEMEPKKPNKPKTALGNPVK
ncbi:unnamed protein product [Nesidiocoris tenuis]|uniref:Uncharacterized protein n=1 Tax=Nesidiocoris tenuis TaxID=355587 RepID=A0A6H5HKD9_9HEMI|nr:unnamed protein product [Nesidiocoris tenuis]